jgi:tRNA(Met) C34 N-acetyltransferase TmcA
VILILLDTLNSIEDFTKLRSSFVSSSNQSPFEIISNRFNATFLQSIQKCGNCVAITDEFGLLNGLHSKPFVSKSISSTKSTFHSDEIEIIELSATKDQSDVIIKTVSILSQFPQEHVIGLTVARSRGESAAIGLVLSAAIKSGFYIIFATSPSISNLQALFEVLIIDLEKMGFKEINDFEKRIDQNKMVYAVNAFKGYRKQSIITLNQPILN